MVYRLDGVGSQRRSSALFIQCSAVLYRRAEVSDTIEHSTTTAGEAVSLVSLPGGAAT